MADCTTKLMAGLIAAGLVAMLLRALTPIPTSAAPGGDSLSRAVAQARRNATVSLSLWSSSEHPSQTSAFGVYTALSHFMEVDAEYQQALEARLKSLEARVARLERSGRTAR